MRDPYCAVEVGTHDLPYWKSGELVMCNRHHWQFNEQFDITDEEVRAMNWQEWDPHAVRRDPEVLT